MCRKTNNINRGFTFIEVLITVSLIAILAAIVMNTLNTAKRKAYTAKATLTAKQIINAIALLEQETGQWPNHLTSSYSGTGTSGNEIWDLNSGEAGLIQNDSPSFPNWGGPYFSISQIPLDPWGNPYFFDPDYDIDPTAGVEWVRVVGSFGPNGVGQNAYDDDDIVVELR